MIRSFDGKSPKIHPSAFISETAYIVGDVEIGEGASVWPGAVIRGDYGQIIIGRNCSIQDNCVLHTDDYLELGDNVLMTHGAVVHGGTIGNNVLIGVNAAVLESAHVGKLLPHRRLRPGCGRDHDPRSFLGCWSAGTCQRVDR